MKSSLHKAKCLRFASLIVVFIILAEALHADVHVHGESRGDDSSRAQALGAATRWACPMMDFVGTAPGACPVCGMKLTPIIAGQITREQARRIDLETVKVSVGPAAVRVRGVGVASYDDRTAHSVLPRVSGRITKRYAGTLHVGELVKENDPLVDLYSQEAYAAQGELAAAIKMDARIAKEALRERFRRWNLLDVAEAIERGEAPRETITVKSPFAGRVLAGGDPGMASRLPQVGEEWMADRPLIRLVDPDSFFIALKVPESKAVWLKPGLPAHLATDEGGELNDVKAQLAWVAPEVDPEYRTREVHVHLHDPSKRIVAGSLVHVRIHSSLTPDLTAADPDNPSTWGDFVLVPKAAVLSTGIRNIVWRAASRTENGSIRFEPVAIALGPRLEDEMGEDKYIVRAGLNAGDEVATRGAFLVDSQAQLAGTPSLLYPTGAAPSPESNAHKH